MSTKVSNLAQVDPQAELGEDVEIGPFCLVGPNVKIGNGTRLDSHVTLIGHTTIGERNRFFQNTVIGAEPQDFSYKEGETRVEIGDENLFREGVTVNRGAEKEDGCTRIGNHNMLMSNSHVAHNCRVFNKVILVNGVLLGGHVHVQDGAIISGNSAVHHFATIGTLAFVSGMSKVVRDIPPFMMAAGTDNPKIKTINTVGLRRNGISEETIRAIKLAHKVLFRKNTPLKKARATIIDQLGGVIPLELSTLFSFLDQQSQGKVGRAREVVREQNGQSQQDRPQGNLRRAA